ncbi:MAG: type II toxin-antitoxin system HicA family toxin [Candidatus Scalindua sp.]
MKDIGTLVHLLRNTPIREIISALERDRFILRRTTQTGGHIYVHPDKKRRVVIHYHHSSDTLTRKTLKSILDGTHWTEQDLKRLKLVK